jgi:hypothetical protein
VAQVEVVNAAREVLGHVQFAFDESLIDDDPGGYIRQLGLAPGFNLLPHRLEAPLHPHRMPEGEL